MAETSNQSEQPKKTRRGRRGRGARSTTSIEAATEEEISSVINLSEVPLSKDQLTVLSKGLSFAPTHNSNLFHTRVDLFRFYRNLHLKAFYYKAGHTRLPTTMNGDIAHDITHDNTPDNPGTSSTDILFKPKSYFTPVVSNPSLIAFCKKVDYEVQDLFETQSRPTQKPNLSSSERNALAELSKMDNIIVRPADKGGAVVVLSKEMYIAEATRQLQSRHYERLRSNPLPTLTSTFHNMLSRAETEGWITENECKYMTVEHPSLATFYLLPKVHKPPFDNPPGRPIISGNGTLTEPASKFVDFFIKPYVRTLPSFIEDTVDVLNSLSRLGNVKSQYLITMDVESLYTNIDHEEGLHALRHFLAERKDTKPPSQFIVELTEFIIYNNVFVFTDKLYKQKIGVPMGCCFSPNYACLYLGLWETLHVFNSSNPFLQCVTWYGRFIDDLMFVFNGTETQVKGFHQYLNSINPNIKLSLEYSQDSINFLDLTVSIDQQGSLHTTIFRKKTSRNTILRADSFHPPHLIENIPFGQFQRLRRICDDEAEFEKQANDMTDRFRKRAYRSHTVERARSSAHALNRSDTLIKKHRNRNNNKKSRPFFVTQYSTEAKQVTRIIKENWAIINSDPELQQVFPEPPLVSYKRAPTLRDKLVHSHLPPERKESWLKRPVGVYRCSNCPHCSHVIQSKAFIDFKSKKEYKIKDFINCNTTFVIYRLSCPCPNIFYVGRTKRRLRDRLAEHKYAIRTGNADYQMAQHFARVHNKNDSLLKIEALEHIRPLDRGGDRIRRLNQRETFWIHQLDALRYPGLNEDIEFKCFL